jgi:K+-transporting ATPase ATPase C chain
MKKIFSYIRISILATLGLGVVFTVVYPAAVWAVAQLVFQEKANGSLIEKNGKVVGSALLGQNFSSPRYFHSRPSAAGKGYDAASSGGSNLGPISGKFLNGLTDDPATKDTDESFAGLKQRVENYRRTNGLAAEAKVPVDAVTASGSGLDPHISIRNAELQLSRVARERRLSVDSVHKLLDQNTDGRDFGILGDPGVNVLKLNLALDSTAG